jgi:glycosyltransferase involved in cell wall biosynthesis
MISILLPVYNTKKEWLMECIGSIHKQTYQDYEVIIVNDGSTNQETINILNELKNESKYKIINNEKNIGIAKSLNIGLKQCKYELVARMDSDDIMLSSRLDIQYNYMIKNPDVDLCGVAMKYLRQTYSGWVEYNLDERHPLIITKEIAKKTNWFLNHPTVMYKKSKVLSVGGYGENMIGYPEDFDLWIRMLKNDMILHNIHLELMIYRFSNDSLSKKFYPDLQQFIQNLQNSL